MIIRVRLTLRRNRRKTSFGEQFRQARLGPRRRGWIAQFENATCEGTQAIEHAGHVPLRAIHARTRWTLGIGLVIAYAAGTWLGETAIPTIIITAGLSVIIVANRCAC